MFKNIIIGILVTVIFATTGCGSNSVQPNSKALAESLYQQGESLYKNGDYGQAKQVLTDVTQKYSDSESAEKAREMLNNYDNKITQLQKEKEIKIKRDKEEAETKKSAQVQSVDAVKYVYTVFGEKDVSTGYAVRKVIQIALPKGLDRKTIEDNITAVASEIEKKYAQNDKGLAIDVYAFTDDDLKLIKQGEYVSLFAECTYAHNGEWNNSDQKYSSSAMKTKISIKDSYFSK